MSVLSGSRIVLGVTGGIAAYKAADFTSKLVQTGAIVDVILTKSATEFVGPATFEALTKRPVHGSVFEAWRESSFGHISLGHGADAIVVAPATANSIAKLASGFADDMLGAVALSTTAPLIIAPAMEHEMFHHPATQANLEILRARGATQIGPEAGRLASGERGDGRMSSPESLVDAVRKVLGRNGPLARKRLVVTAGGTQEPLDPVRFLGNRSSGQMGYAIARAAMEAGAEVTLITTPTVLPLPYGVEIKHVVTADQMFAEVRHQAASADVLVMSAAVADFRPAESHDSKIKKLAGQERMTIDLVRNPDIIASVNRSGLYKVGFAAETEALVEHASTKLREKKLDLIVANDAVQTIGSEESEATLLAIDEAPVALARMTKIALAGRIVEEIAARLAKRGDA